MAAKITTETQGVKGGNTKINETGFTRVSDGEYVISIDAFEGYGNQYKQRESVEVSIFHSGDIIFEGTFNELKNILLNKHNKNN